jgi:hypothetical protein
MRRITVLLAIPVILLLLVTPAAASPPLGVVIEAEVRGLGSGPWTGPFTATGQAVDDGLMCPSGTTLSTWHRTSGGGPYTNIQVAYLFTCADLSGDFTVFLTARFGGDLEWSTGAWRVIGGSGDYEGLHGSGKLQGFYECGPDCIIDTYTGKLH